MLLGQAARGRSHALSQASVGDQACQVQRRYCLVPGWRQEAVDDVVHRFRQRQGVHAGHRQAAGCCLQHHQPLRLNG
ncbi:MAG TPA: hypothetical protein ENI37_04320 [Chloroflexi bacterium]|nr:hypothetical protein [Chloroflexota bacterium]